MKQATKNDKSRRRPQQVRSIETFEGVLVAAAAVLERTGFDGFSMQSVADEAKLAIGTLYQYFPNKYTLLRTLLEGWYARSEKREDPWKGLMPDIDALADVYLNEPGGTALLEAIQAVPELRRYDRAKMNAGVSKIADRLSGGRTATPAHIAEARVTLFAIDGVLREAARLPAEDAKRMVNVLKRWIERRYSKAPR